jgi:spore coat polysaccharide biosynthesis protein SpsF
MSQTIAIIQARMSSSRLPGKVLLDIADQPMLARVVERTRLASTVDQVVVATTTDPADDPLARLCLERGFPCFRGSHFDVLDRLFQAARQFEAGTIVRITADCPLIDPQVIDRTVKAFFGEVQACDRVLPFVQSEIDDRQQHSTSEHFGPFDFAANRLPPPWGRTYPVGLDTEVCSFQGLETVWGQAAAQHQREHVMPFFYDNMERFRLVLVNHDKDYGALRWTVDTAEDLELVRRIYAWFPSRSDFTWLEVLELLERHPELAEINAQVQAKDYRQFDRRQG